MRVSCSDPTAEHLLIEGLLIEGLDHYRLGVSKKAEWVHWYKTERPIPGDILEVCHQPPPAAGRGSAAREGRMRDEWNLAKAERREPVMNRRSIVSVAFKAEEFASLTAKAKAEGKSLSGYIHDRAMLGVSIPTVHLLVDGEQIYVQATS